MMKKLLKAGIALAVTLLLVACSKEQPPRDPNIVRVGTIAGPETELVEVARDVAFDKYGLKVEIIEFEDYVLPNTALVDGALDVNVFQHRPYLDIYMAKRNAPLVVAGHAFVYPMGVYSKKHKDFEAVPNKAKIAIPNDSSNESRALLLLQKAGLIKLKEEDRFDFTPKDITENPHGIKFVELDAAQLPRILPDVDYAVINTNYSLAAGLLPSRDALVLEDANSPYANIIVVREDNMNDDNIRLFVKSFQSRAVTQKAEALFEGQAIPAWK